MTEGCGFGRGEAVIVAEAGSSHGGELARGYELIDQAAEAGADWVKFQVIYADEIVHPLTGVVELAGGTVSLYHRFKELEREAEFYARLKEHTEQRGCGFLCSAFGLKSSRLLRDLGVEAIKVASPELNHYPLLEEAASYGIPIILSTGVSTLGDIEKALEITGELGLLLHCVTSYPAPEDEYNLKLVPNLRALFGRPVGVSDHSRDPLLVPALAVLEGAFLIEKHFSLSASGCGLDDPIALEPNGFRRLVDGVRRVESLGPEEGRRWLEAEYGGRRLKGVLGDGVKRLAPSERSYYRTTNRSIHALEAIGRGEPLSEDRICLVRSERNLRPGLGPEYLPIIRDRPARRDIPAGQGVVWEDVLGHL